MIRPTATSATEAAQAAQVLQVWGLDVQGRKGWTGWSNIGWQFGSQSHHAFIGWLGAKYTW